MGKRLVLLCLSFLLMLGCTACGDSYENGFATSDSYKGGAGMNGSAEYGYESAESPSAYDYDYDYSSDASLDDSAGQLGSGQIKDVSKEMLVYTCDMAIDVLEFDDAVAAFRARLNEFGGFVESEEYSDDGSSSRYYDRKAVVWHRYIAKVRVPSSRYEEFCNGVSTIGDLRSKTAYVDNLSQEYSDAKTALAIYEAKQERYIALLSTIEDDEYALQVEKELTEIQITIAKLKTRMNKIETDVAYSYVNVRINEVKEYKEEPIKTDTFLQRLGNTVRDTWEDFLDFLEDLLFFLIRILPYLLIIIVILVIFKAFKLTDKIRGKHYANQQKRKERELRRAQEQELRYQQFQQLRQQDQRNPQNGQGANGGNDRPQ